MKTYGRSVAVLGYRGVGKSAVTIQYVDGTFVEAYHPTIENTFHKTIRYRGQPLEITIRDTSGQDASTSLHSRLAVGVHGYLLVYSVDNRHSFDVVQYINDKLLTSFLGTKNVARVLVGNKCDLEVERQVSTEEGQELASRWECPFMECSAKMNRNIDEAFQKLLVEIRREELGNSLPEKLPFCWNLLPRDSCKSLRNTDFLQRFLKLLIGYCAGFGACNLIAGFTSLWSTTGRGSMGYLLALAGLFLVVGSVLGFRALSTEESKPLKQVWYVWLVASLLHIATTIILWITWDSIPGNDFVANTVEQLPTLSGILVIITFINEIMVSSFLPLLWGVLDNIEERTGLLQGTINPKSAKAYT